MEKDGDKKRGPLEEYVSETWNAAEKSLEHGRPAEALIEAIETSLRRQRGKVKQEDIEKHLDLDAAENLHIFRKIRYQQDVAIKRQRSEHMRWMVDEISQHIQNLNLHLFKSVTLAHGAGVVASVAYLGQGHSRSLAFPIVIVICSIGFLMSLLSARISIYVNMRLQALTLSMSNTYLAETERQKAGNQILHLNAKGWKYEWATAVSILLLIAAVGIGLIEFWPENKLLHGTEHQTSSESATPIAIPNRLR